MDKPTFSVIMPAYNTASMIGEAIASVLAQTRADFELLVVDDGSTDGTLDVARRATADARVRLLQTSQRGGPGAARNLGIAHARADYVCMLDSDDLWLPPYLDAVGAALGRNPSAGLACTGHWILEEPPGLIRRRRTAGPNQPTTALDADAFLLSLLRRNFVLNSSVTARREVLEALDGCNADLAAAVDLDLWLRIAAAGYGAVFIPAPLAIYRFRRGSIQNDPRNESRPYASLASIYRAVAENWDVTPEAKKIARDQLDIVERHLATLSGRRRLARALLQMRRRVNALRRRLLRRWIWYASPPSELAAVRLGNESGSLVDRCAG